MALETRDFQHLGEQVNLSEIDCKRTWKEGIVFFGSMSELAVMEALHNVEKLLIK